MHAKTDAISVISFILNPACNFTINTGLCTDIFETKTQIWMKLSTLPGIRQKIATECFYKTLTLSQ